jgi:acyl phosphate:glycerol-3-phosphate acyltransferase
VTEALAVVLAYLLGSIPFAYLAGRSRGVDLRTVGSGNLGAANVFRTLGRDMGIAVMVADILKGVVAVVIARLITDDPWPAVAAAAAMAGHVFPVWLRFKGGKGVATTLGTLIAANWMVGIGACLVWLAIAVLFRYSSLSALMAVAAAPFLALWLGTHPQAWLAAFAALLVWIRHSDNIHRLLKGEEPKIGKKKEAAPPAQ